MSDTKEEVILSVFAPVARHLVRPLERFSGNLYSNVDGVSISHPGQVIEIQNSVFSVTRGSGSDINEAVDDGFVVIVPDGEFGVILLLPAVYDSKIERPRLFTEIGASGRQESTPNGTLLEERAPFHTSVVYW